MDILEQLYAGIRINNARDWMQLAGDEIRQLRSIRDLMLTAAVETLQDNAHLADGDVCTLLKLKLAVESLGMDWEKEE